jgi:hypothetical protein
MDHMFILRILHDACDVLCPERLNDDGRPVFCGPNMRIQPRDSCMISFQSCFCDASLRWYWALHRKLSISLSLAVKVSRQEKPPISPD